nr:AAA family ATPase [Segatella baroniae]
MHRFVHRRPLPHRLFHVRRVFRVHRQGIWIERSDHHQRLAGFEQLMHGEILGTKKYLRDFSEGNRQKVGIIGAMLIQPRVLILDEPFNYLDPSSQILISKLIERECRERGTTVILSSHNLNVVSDISTRILLLEKGVVVKDLANDAGSAMTELEAYFDTTQPASEDRQDLSD